MGLILMHIVCPHIWHVTDCQCLEAKIKGQRYAICFYYQLHCEAASSLKKKKFREKQLGRNYVVNNIAPHTFIE